MAVCSVEGCEKAIQAKGLCGAHYRRNRLHGDPLAGGPLQAAPGSPVDGSNWCRITRRRLP